jgi:hypothetical protein
VRPVQPLLRILHVVRVVPAPRAVRGAVPALRAGAVLAIVTTAAACSGGGAGSAQAAQASHPATAAASASRPATAPSAAASATASSTPRPRPKPKPKPKVRPHVVLSTVHTADGAVITVAAFRGPVTFALHNGSEDPGYAASQLGVRAGPAIGSAERRHVLAAFNGGFKLAVGAGGYEQERKVVSPLIQGDASFIIDASGKARIALWGYGAPAPGEKIYSVRQNLGLLVEGGKPVSTAAYWQDWGATIGGVADVARSAVGMDSAGDIIYAASMSALPGDLATALADKGARIGMELDINPEWVQLDVASRPGGTLRAAVPGQWRPADQYVYGWIRDFFTVLAS